MKFMEIKDLWDLGYEMGKNENIAQDVKAILLKDNYGVEAILTEIAHELDLEFYFSIVFYDNEHAYSVVKIDGEIYESFLETKEDIASAIENSYSCDGIAIFVLKDDKLECIGY